MDNDILDPNPNDPQLQVVVGNGTAISMQTVQHIYNEITGRTEEIAQHYSLNHMLDYDDLRQLSQKIEQMYEQYNIVSQNCAVTLYCLGDQRQTFSSFKRFELYDRTTLSPVENIRLEFNFLIVLPATKKPQSYSIEINIHSRAAMEMRAQADGEQMPFFMILSPKTAHLEIKYIDYTVARNFQHAIDTWFKGLKTNPSNKFVSWAQKHSDNIPFLAQIIGYCTFLPICFYHFSELLARQPSLRGLFEALAVTIGGSALLALVLGRIGRIGERAIDRITTLSYINLTRGDQNAFEASRRSNAVNYRNLCLTVAGAIVAHVVAAWLILRLGLTS